MGAKKKIQFACNVTAIKTLQITFKSNTQRKIAINKK